jgi:hypothetical protein
LYALFLSFYEKTCKYMATNHGLQKWYEIEFEKLGWMVLSKEYG